MCRNKIPEAGAGIFINKNHVLDVEYLICNPVDHITIRFVFFIVIDCRHNIIRIPKPVFVPCQIITKNCPMCTHGITFIGFFQLIALSLYTTHISRNLTVLRKLIILNFIRDLVWDQFPSLTSVVRNWIWVKITDILAFLFHVFQCLFQKLMHQSHVGVFRISADSGQTSHCISLAKDSDMHRVDCHLWNKSIIVKPANDICLFHSRKFCADDLALLPSDRA